MKISSALLSALFFFSMSGCQKLEDYIEIPQLKQNCDLIKSIEPGGGLLFLKELNRDTKKPDRIVASAYTVARFDSVALKVRYNGNVVYFLYEESIADTFMTASFKNGKLDKLTRGNAPDKGFKFNFPSMTFSYSGNRLSGYARVGETLYDPEEDTTIKSDDFIAYIRYDNYGNVTQILDDGSATPAITYTYDTNVKASGQFYPDAFGVDYGSSTLYLAEFMGWVPDLMPVNIRISSAFNGDGTYLVNHYSNHLFDSNRNLTSYTIDNKSVAATYSNVWACK